MGLFKKKDVEKSVEKVEEVTPSEDVLVNKKGKVKEEVKEEVPLEVVIANMPDLQYRVLVINMLSEILQHLRKE